MVMKFLDRLDIEVGYNFGIHYNYINTITVMKTLRE